MNQKPIQPPSYLLISIFVIAALFFIFPEPVLIPSPWNLLGLFPLGFGVWINLSADRAFQQEKTTVKPLEDPTTLITHGAFALSRNPMYLGFVAILLGIALLIRTVHPYLVVIIFAVFMDRKFIRIEEMNLERKFGSAWEAYKSKVRRWI
jgi:protein-S-isoprenylcysteine O-methyltransferase Ste14